MTILVLSTLSACPDSSKQSKFGHVTEGSAKPFSGDSIHLGDGGQASPSSEASALPSVMPGNTAMVAIKLVQFKQNPQIHYLSSEQIQTLTLAPVRDNEVARPVRMAFDKGFLYVLMRGQLMAYAQSDLFKPQNKLQATNLMPTANHLPSGEPIRELVDLASLNNQLVLLDKSNDVYQLDPGKKSWRMFFKSRNFTDQPDPHYIALESFGSRAYLLDYARNQIWRKTADPAPVNRYFQREVPSWQIKAGDPDLTEAIDFYIDGDIYVLTRQGQIQIYSNGKVKQLKTVDLTKLEAPYQNIPAEKPLFQSLRGDKDFLYALDAANTRVIQIAKKPPYAVKQWVFLSQDGEWGRMHDLQIHNGKLWLLAGNQVLMYPAKGNFDPKAQPVHSDDTAKTVLTKAGRQLDPRLKGLSEPVPGALFPDNAGILPGSRRVYRQGIHEGADFFDRFNPQQGGKYLRYGSSVVAIKDGTIKRIDHGFREMTPPVYQQVLAECQTTHHTSRVNEDKFRGRQVWIEHEGGVVSVYAHLSKVEPELKVGTIVTQGQKIGEVGNSGTSGSIQGNRNNPHLHLEIWLSGVDTEQGEYLGKWLSLAETRELWESVFEGT